MYILVHGQNRHANGAMVCAWNLQWWFLSMCVCASWGRCERPKRDCVAPMRCVCAWKAWVQMKSVSFASRTSHKVERPSRRNAFWLLWGFFFVARTCLSSHNTCFYRYVLVLVSPTEDPTKLNSLPIQMCNLLYLTEFQGENNFVFFSFAFRLTIRIALQEGTGPPATL